MAGESIQRKYVIPVAGATTGGFARMEAKVASTVAGVARTVAGVARPIGDVSDADCPSNKH